MILKILLTFLVLMVTAWIEIKGAKVFNSTIQDILEVIFIISFPGATFAALIYIWVSL